MSQNNSNDKAAMLAKIEGINEVEGFDPTPFAVEMCIRDSYIAENKYIGNLKFHVVLDTVEEIAQILNF